MRGFTLRPSISKNTKTCNLLIFLFASRQTNRIIYRRTSVYCDNYDGCIKINRIMVKADDMLKLQMENDRHYVTPCHREI